MIRTEAEFTSSVELLVARVSEEFAAALGREESPNVEAYAARYPQIADVLRRILPAVEAMESLSADGAAADVVAGAERAPRELGDFRILREIGRGGMGVVYEAEQISLRRRVALKVLPFAATLDVKQLQRFKNEAHSAAQLQHPHIVSVHSVGNERGVYYYAMQLIEGQSIAEMIRELRGEMAPPASEIVATPLTAPPAVAEPTASNPPKSPPKPDTVRVQIAARPTERSISSRAFFRSVAQLGIQAAEALQHAHDVGIIHRDIKPANLLVNDQGHLWVTDFGLARLADDTNMTLTGDLVGTLRYMSPEQATGKPTLIDQRTDVYSLGATLYELASLRAVFEGDDRRQLLRQVIDIEPSSPRRHNPAIPADLETIALKALEKNPLDRYATAQELADDLRRFLEEKPIQARRPNWVERARKWSRKHRGIMLSVAAALVVSFVALAVSIVLILAAYRQQSSARAKAEQESDRAKFNLGFARRVVDDMYTKFAHKWIAQQRGLDPVQEEFLKKAADFYEQVASQQSDEPEIVLQTALSLTRLGEIQLELGENQRASQSQAKAVAILDELSKRNPALVRNRDDVIDAYETYAFHLHQTGDTARAGDVLRRCIALREEKPADLQSSAETLALCYSLSVAAQVERNRGDNQQARLYAQKALQLHLELPSGTEDWAESRIYRSLAASVLGQMAFDEDKCDEAVRAHHEAVDLLAEPMKDAVSAESVRINVASRNFELGQVLVWTNRPQEAEAPLATALEIQRKDLANHRGQPRRRFDLALSLEMLGRVRCALKQFDQARSALLEAEGILMEIVRHEPDSVRAWHVRAALADARFRLGIVMVRLKDDTEAERQFRSAIELLNVAVHDDPGDSAEEQSLLSDCQRELARVLAKRQRPTEAEPLLQSKGVKLPEDAPGPDPKKPQEPAKTPQAKSSADVD